MLIDFIETDTSMITNKVEVVSTTDHNVNTRTDCYNIMDAMKCSLMMMGVGNSGWDGPYIHFVYTTLDIGDITKVKAKAGYCATNMMGNENCNKLTNTDWVYSLNQVLQRFEQQYLIKPDSADVTSP